MPYRVVLDDEVIARAKQEAEPLVDSVNSVIRRALGLERVPQAALYFAIEEISETAAAPRSAADEVARPRRPRSTSRRRARKARPRAPRGSLLDERAYWRPILEVLAGSANGAAAAREVIERVGPMLTDQLTELDRESDESGVMRWQRRVQFARLRMKDAGLIERGSPRGIWQISEQGRRFLDGKAVQAA